MNLTTSGFKREGGIGKSVPELDTSDFDMDLSDSDKVNINLSPYYQSIHDLHSPRAEPW